MTLDVSKFYCTIEIYFCQVKPNFYFDGFPWSFCVYDM